MNSDTIRHSFIWDIALEAYKGSAKVAYIHKTLEELRNKKTTIPHPRPRAHQGETLEYRAKYVVLASSTLSRALIYAYIYQTFREEHVVHAYNAVTRDKEVPK